MAGNRRVGKDQCCIAGTIKTGIDFSDHLNYWREGYQAAMVTDTAFYCNPNLHSSADTPDTLDYKRMAQVVQGVCAAVRAEAAS